MFSVANFQVGWLFWKVISGNLPRYLYLQIQAGYDLVTKCYILSLCGGFSIPLLCEEQLEGVNCTYSQIFLYFSLNRHEVLSVNQVEIPKQGYSSGKSDRLLLRTVVISDTGTDLGLEAVLLPHGYQLLDRSSFCSYFHFCKRDTSDYNEIAGCCLQDQSLKSPRNCSEKITDVQIHFQLEL